MQLLDGIVDVLHLPDQVEVLLLQLRFLFNRVEIHVAQRANLLAQGVGLGPGRLAIDRLEVLFLARRAVGDVCLTEIEFQFRERALFEILAFDFGFTPGNLHRVIIALNMRSLRAGGIEFLRRGQQHLAGMRQPLLDFGFLRRELLQRGFNARHLLAGLGDHRLVLLDLRQTAIERLLAQIVLPLGLLQRDLDVPPLAPRGFQRLPGLAEVDFRRRELLVRGVRFSLGLLQQPMRFGNGDLLGGELIAEILQPREHLLALAG